MTIEEYNRYIESHPPDTVLVSVEDGTLVINAPGDIVFTPEACDVSPLTTPMYVELIACMGTLQKVKAVRDESGHWYVIPVELYENFCTLVADEEEVDEFDFIFGKYMTGGCLNLIQLYAEI